jgi:hypothetical protein
MEINQFNRSDVPAVGLHDLYVPFKHLIGEGRGLALFNGLSEKEIRAVESHVWAHFSGDPEKRLAVALRFRALLQVFAARRLRQAFLQQGFKLIALAAAEGATQRLNTRFGFKAQAFVIALDPTARTRAASNAKNARNSEVFSLAA